MTVPSEMLAWQLYGVGFEKFGKDDKPAVLPVPEPKDNELLMKINAIGLCFSDVKLIRAGEEHPRVKVKSLAENPLVPGHEAVMTIVKVGKALEGKYKPGQRFIIQADVYYKGEGWAYGYALDGGMEQYSIVGEKVLNGDEGCYLLPLADHTPSAIAALLEPWTCVMASHLIQKRTVPLKGGKMCFVFACDCCQAKMGALVSASQPSEVALCGKVPAAFEAEVKAAFPAAKIVKSEKPEGKFDDIFLCGFGGEVSAFHDNFALNCCINLIECGEGTAASASVDVGSIHYQGWFFQGTRGKDMSAAYGRNVRSTLKKGGSCWLSGGAGAMGQMHTQLAVLSADGPSKILVTDMDDARIANVEKLLGAAAKARGAEFKLVNPKNMTPEAFSQLLKEFAPGGFDDIVMLVPVPAVVSDNAKYLGKDGLMNIFAGIPAGKEAVLPMENVISGGARYIGSSGSRTEDLRATLALAEAGKLDPETALAAIGGIKDLKKGLDAVANAKFPGKTVILPNCPDMPLVTKAELGKLDPAIAKALADNGGKYGLAAEKVILEKYGC